jgi:hypothetical protein
VEAEVAEVAVGQMFIGLGLQEIPVEHRQVVLVFGFREQMVP